MGYKTVVNQSQSVVSSAFDSMFAAKPQASSSSSNTFESYLGSAQSTNQEQQKVQAERKAENKNNNNKSNNVNQAEKQERQQSKPYQKKAAEQADNNRAEKQASAGDDTKKVAENNTKPAETTKAEKPSESAQKNAEPVEEMEAVKKIAEALGMTPEAVMQILNSLSMTVKDLADQANLSKFMQAAFDLSSPAELLNVPNIKELFAVVKEAASEVSEASAKTPQTAQFVEADGKFNLAQPLESETAIEATDKTVVKQAVETEQTNQTVPVETTDTTKAAEVSAKPAVAAASVQTTETEQAAPQANEEQPQPVAPSQTAQNSTSGGSQQFNQNNGNNDVLGETLGNSLSDGIPANVQANQQVSTTFTEAAQKASATPRASVDHTEILNQVLDRIKVEFRGNVSEIKMTLRPESLGEVSMKLSVENGIITAQFLAENQRVKETLESNFNQLRDALQKQGIEVSSLSVSVGSERGNQMLGEFQKGRSQAAMRIKSINKGLQAEGEAEAEIEEAPMAVEENVANFFA